MNQTYVVKRGDTLYGISNQFGVSVTELASLNGVNANTLQIGQTLIIPIKSGENPDNLFYYTVKSGDTLYSIARIYNTTADEIKKLNYLTSDNLKIGQVLRIPEVYIEMDKVSVPNYINYTVKSGDTLYSIARKYNISVNQLMKDNSLSNTNLTVGMNLKIRTVLEEYGVEECFGEEYNGIIPSSTIEYVVKSGDSLYKIAKRYNTSVSDLLIITNLSNSNLQIGQILKIPSSDIVYQVVKGDSLYSIAKKFNTSVDSIKKKNSLNSNVLQIGQLLKI